MAGEVSLSFESRDGETVRVDAAVSMMHPEQCTFTVSRALYPDYSVFFASPDDAKDSPLAERLFETGAVSGVLVSDNSLTVTLKGDSGWESMIPRVGAVIQQVFDSDEPPVSTRIADAMLGADELKKKIEDVLEKTINPAVASHGGYVHLIDVKNNSVFLEFGGGCQGCGMINVTLKYGVERAIREQVPSVGEILDTTDHASGRNPYFTPSAK